MNTEKITLINIHTKINKRLAPAINNEQQ